MRPMVSSHELSLLLGDYELRSLSDLANILGVLPASCGVGVLDGYLVISFERLATRIMISFVDLSQPLGNFLIHFIKD